jgi:ABC-type Fe3+-hydroxamate transport system substrate-binding protein
LGKVANGRPRRVVSLIASATEIICALGARDLLIGRSHECDFPPDVTRSPSLTQPKFPVTGTSYDIGPRIVESLEILAEVFHPELFPSRHERKGWMRYRAVP